MVSDRKFQSNEDDRLRIIADFDLQEEELEDDFQHIVELAASICEVPSALISIIGEDRVWYKGRVGIASSGTSRDISFCSHTIQQDELFVVKDARTDARFLNNPVVCESPNIVFYAGFPIKALNQNLGALCVLDNAPRELSENQINNLHLLSKQVTKLLELRGKERELQRQNNLISKNNQELLESNSINKQLMSMISHDIRGPVGSILTFFKSKKGAENNVELIIKILPLMEVSLKSIYTMVDNMLDWSSYISNPKLEQVNLLRVVEDTKRLCASQLNVKDNKLLIHVDEDIHAYCDKNALLFIMRNLITNAIKYTSAGEINVVAKLNKDDIIVSVTDTGIGISDLLLEKILNHDKKVSTAGTNQEKGSGMGINLVQQFLKKMDTELKITSVQREGSTFSFSLPKAV